MKWLIAVLLIASTCHPLFFLAAVVALWIWSLGQKESAQSCSNTIRRKSSQNGKL